MVENVKIVSKIVVSIYLIAAVLAMSVVPAMAATSGAINYVAFGDSVASGVRGGVSEPGSDYGYTDDIAGMLKNAGVLSSFNESFCVSGMTAKRLVPITDVLNDKTSSGYKLVEDADIATLDIGANDLLTPLYEYVHSLSSIQKADTAKMKEIMNTVVSEIYDGTTAPEVQANIETILQNIINANPDIKIYVMGYYNPLPAASAMVGLDLNASVAAFNVYIQKAVSDVAAKNTGASILYVDTMTAMAADSADNFVMTDIHPTPAGYTVIANEFWKQISILLGDSTDSSAAASPTKSTVLVNGHSVAFEAYNIGGSNYFKLRDIAMTLNGTEKQFNVSWDSSNKIINLTSAATYTAVGGELNASGNTADAVATQTAATVHLDSKAITLTAYVIGNNNYIKLRDLASVINFSVVWDSGTSTISIDTTQGYTVPSAS
jgi:lysophospholipase L1-like esterase